MSFQPSIVHSGHLASPSTLAAAFENFGQIKKAHIVRNHGEEFLKVLSDKIKSLLSKWTNDFVDDNGVLVGVSFWDKDWVVVTDVEKPLYASVAVSEEDPLLKEPKCKKISNLVAPVLQQGALSKNGQGADPVSSEEREVVLKQVEQWSQSHK